jgi:transcriptional regulator with XRE-family HTH domain
MDQLIEWINEELTLRGWSLRELARRAKVSTGALSMVMNQQRGAGPEFCRSIARALGVPPEQVFRLAGLLPAQSQRKDEVEELLFYYGQLTPDNQARARMLLRALAEERAEYDGETNPRLQGTTATA